MRYLACVLLFFCMCWGKSYGQIVDRGSITWLQNNISFSRDQITKPGGKNSTRIFICKEQVDSINMNSKKLFCHQIVSYVQWEQEGVVIENDIYKHGRVREKYTYRIPYKAIVSGSLSNCQPNKFGFVTAYHERPIFIKVRRNTIEVGHARYDMNGICHPVLYRTNSDDTDWETTIPIAGNWDDRQHLSEKLMGILNDIAEKNRTKLVIR